MEVQKGLYLRQAFCQGAQDVLVRSSETLFIFDVPKDKEKKEKVCEGKFSVE